VGLARRDQQKIGKIKRKREHIAGGGRSPPGKRKGGARGVSLHPKGVRIYLSRLTSGIIGEKREKNPHGHSVIKARDLKDSRIKTHFGV